MNWLKEKFLGPERFMGPFKTSLITGSCLFIICSSCSSSRPKEEFVQERHEDLQKTYTVLDSNMKKRPVWPNSPQEWAEKYEESESKKMRYYTYETDPKGSRSLACHVAKAYASANLAQEIQQSIRNELQATSMGDSAEKLDEYVNLQLRQDIHAQIVGAQVHRTYWEHRKYAQERGAPRDYDAYVCAALIRIPKRVLKEALSNVQKRIQNQVQAERVGRVRKAMKKVEKKWAI